MAHSGYDLSRLASRRPDIDAAQIADTTPPTEVPSDEVRAEQLYRRYGASPWALLPEATREHFRGLVAAGIDGQGLPLDHAGDDHRVRGTRFSTGSFLS